MQCEIDSSDGNSIQKALDTIDEVLKQYPGSISATEKRAEAVAAQTRNNQPRGRDGGNVIHDFCSHCHYWTDHKRISGGIFGSLANPTSLLPGSRERYECSSCDCQYGREVKDGTLVRGNFARYGGMAKGGLGWDCDQCHQCDTNVMADTLNDVTRGAAKMPVVVVVDLLVL